MKSTFSTIFYLKRQAARKDGTVPVMGRITVDGTQTQFSCKITIDPKVMGYKKWSCHRTQCSCYRSQPYA